MKKMTLLSLSFMTALCLFGCDKQETENLSDSDLKISDRKIPIDEITDFYYTYDNINFNAFYQRYRFYMEDGKHMFFHETREVKNDYGPATEENRTAYGNFELSTEEWQKAFELLKDGTVSKRVESTESGDSGPWMFIYWKNDKGKYQEYSFASYGDRLAFEEYCASLAER